VHLDLGHPEDGELGDDHAQVVVAHRADAKVAVGDRAESDERADLHEVGGISTSVPVSESTPSMTSRFDPIP
jgi:hypothetical protein